MNPVDCHKCAIKNCDNCGTESIGKYIPNTYKSDDGVIYFCITHIFQAIDLYSIYKALESHIPTIWICTGGDYITQPTFGINLKKQLQSEEFRDRLLYLSYDLDICISLRKTFQESLKPEIYSYGHVKWIENLVKLKKACHTIYVDRGMRWDRELSRYVDPEPLYGGWTYVERYVKNYRNRY